MWLYRIQRVRSPTLRLTNQLKIDPPLPKPRLFRRLDHRVLRRIVPDRGHRHNPLYLCTHLGLHPICPLDTRHCGLPDFLQEVGNKLNRCDIQLAQHLPRFLFWRHPWRNPQLAKKLVHLRQSCIHTLTLQRPPSGAHAVLGYRRRRIPFLQKELEPLQWLGARVVGSSGGLVAPGDFGLRVLEFRRNLVGAVVAIGPTWPGLDELYVFGAFGVGEGYGRVANECKCCRGR